MKRISFFLALVLTVMSFGMANAQNTLNIDAVDGYHPDHIGTGLGVATGGTATITISIGATVDAGINTKLTGYSTGFQLYSGDGATWTDFNGAYTGWPTADYDGGVFQNDFGPDTVTFAGFTIFGDGTPAGFAGPTYELSFVLPFSAVGTNICFDSTTSFPPSNAWKWTDATSDVFPTWAGPFCWEIFEITNQAPTIDNNPLTIEANHCGSETFTFVGSDLEDDPFTFEIVSGPGTINANSGEYTWTPTGFGDVGASITLEVRATGFPGPGPVETVNLVATNLPPTFSAGCDTRLVGKTGADLTIQMGATDNCPGDPTVWAIEQTSIFGSDVEISPMGLITLNTLVEGEDTLTVEVGNGDGPVNTCEVIFKTSASNPYGVSIEKDEGQFGSGAIGGMFTYVDVTLDYADEPIGGFNFLFAYDNSVLSFNLADEMVSHLYNPDSSDCNWEYFTYRVGADGNCSGGCPSGMVRVIGIAETNNGPYHPDLTCNVADLANKKLFTLKFLVSSNALYECQYAPVRFFWTECGDNTMTNVDGTKLFVEGTIAAYDNADDFSNSGVEFPTYLGVQDECLNTTPGSDKPDAEEVIDFVNGGVDIICADEIDARGDLNLDEIPYTIADAVIFTNYFVKGVSAFDALVDQGFIYAVEAARAASDVNVDGLTFTVADLVYLIRVVVGDAAPYPKTAAVEATYSVSNGAVSVDAPMAAAQIIVKGNATPELYANNMDMLYHFDGTNTNIIVYSMEANETFEGTFINAGGEVTYIEMATYDGSPVAAKNVPSDFGLAQNYPNPFNPTTVIEFSLPVKSDVSLNVYNVTGQLVETFNGTFEAGTHEFEWDASGAASGVYFYRIAAGDFNKTMKMVLLK